MKPQVPHDPLEDKDLNRLLQASPRVEASPAFAQNTLRRLRLDEAQNQSWWSSLRSKPVAMLGTLGALTACLAIALWSSFPQGSERSDPIAHLGNSSSPALGLEDYLHEEFLLVAVDHPDLFSDSELLAFLD